MGIDRPRPRSEEFIAPIPEDRASQELKEKNLQPHQEAQLSKIARAFLDEGHPEQAFALIKRSEGFSAGNLLTLMGIGTISRESRAEVKAFFNDYVKKAENFDQLMLTYLFVKKPGRSFLDRIYGKAMKARLSELNPDWDGQPINKGKISAERTVENLRIPIDQITEPKLCLDLAQSASLKQRRGYLEKYLELGGDENNKRYLKITIDSIFSGAKLGKNTAELVRTLASQMDDRELKAWVRRKTRRLQKDTSHPKFPRLVLATYLDLKHGELDSEEWTYIAERAIDINDLALQRICFKYMKGVSRDKPAQEIFEMLLLKFGEGAPSAPRTHSTLRNPVYEDIGTRTPVDKAALRAVTEWAQNNL